MQVVSKSCKVIPVMLVGKALHGKSYPWVEYIEAVGITIGVSMFSLSESKNKTGDSGTQVRLLFSHQSKERGAMNSKPSNLPP
jgi:hypothetical protein